MLRGYYAQQFQQVSFNSSSDSSSAQDQQQEQVQTWPQKRYYRAYCQEDDDAVAAVMAKYGIHAKEEAVRLALRLAAGEAIKVTTNATAARRIVIRLKKPSG